MPDAALITEAEELVELLGAESPTVRLAALASPACRIEPELLRGLRRRCVPEADVAAEQELWFSELVASRGSVITLTAAARHVLRDRLRDLVQERPSLVDQARDEIARAHAHLPAVLRLEDEIAWAEVLGDRATIEARAEAIVSSLRAGREGLDEWLARAWSGLSQGLAATDHGNDLAEVAASRGAQVDDVEVGEASDVIDLVPTTTLLLDRRGSELRIGVHVDEATIAIEVPDTRAKRLEVRADDRSWTHKANTPTTIDVGHGAVTLITESGAEYEIDALVDRRVFSIEMLPARHGTSVLITYGDHDDYGDARHLLVDAGPSRRGVEIASELERRDVAQLEILALTHIDDDVIGGAIPLLETARHVIGDIWFNGRDVLDGGSDGEVAL